VPEATSVIRVTVLDRGFDGQVRTTWAVLGLLGLALLGGSLLVADQLGRRFVLPIKALAASAVRLGENDLSSPVPQEGPPEVQEVGAALNRLVGRVEQLLRRERDNVADLSHRLRTPITALRLDAESLADPTERERLARDIDALERMVDAVIREARRSQREGLAASGDVVEAVAERTAFWAPLADDQGRSFEVDVPGTPLAVAASRADLDALVDVLLDNVFSHTPEGTAVRVSVAPDGDGVLLTVADDGPGFLDLDLVGRGRSAAGSTGLGLDIARRTADSSGGRLDAGRADGGVGGGGGVRGARPRSPLRHRVIVTEHDRPLPSFTALARNVSAPAVSGRLRSTSTSPSRSVVRTSRKTRSPSWNSTSRHSWPRTFESTSNDTSKRPSSRSTSKS
jgi:signal transduction histidine kinase